MLRALLPLLLVLGACGPSGPIVLNEFIASNQGGVVDITGDTPDWIELHNTTWDQVALDGWFITDDPDELDLHPLDGLSVPAKGYLLLYASGDTGIGDEHLPFRLSMAGEEVLLSGPDGVADSFAFGEQTSDTALARIPDGTGSWAAAEPTPGESNQ
ncbi:MAG: lamin tail domain-containing protein [Proteobacteria bacterium]|nr:lamin tail domain-containing protein [Pseudomonadota bacterium]